MCEILVKLMKLIVKSTILKNAFSQAFFIGRHGDGKRSEEIHDKSPELWNCPAPSIDPPVGKKQGSLVVWDVSRLEIAIE